jgi:hypothetical protein
MQELSLEPGKQSSLFLERMPFKPYCVDNFSDGLKIRRKVEAIKRRHVQYNTPAKVAYLCFDVDKDRAHESWYDANLPAPSLVVQNPDNGHAHLLYALEVPICRTNAARLKPLRYLAAVEEGLRMKLEADQGFAGLMCKTPHHKAWRTFESCFDALYDLGELAEYVDLPKKSPKRLGIRTGLGRNVELFDRLRYWAYRLLGDYKAKSNFERWSAVVFSQCQKYNDFDQILPLSEVKATAKSVAKWTWTKYTGKMDDSDFSKIQAQRAKERNIQKPQKKLTLKIEAMQELTPEKIANSLGVSRRTIGRYTSTQRDFWLEKHNVEKLKPWDVLGISRATWYRRKQD